MLGDSIRRRHSGPEDEPAGPARTRPRTRSRFGIRHWLAAAAILLLGSFGVGYLISTQILFPKPETAGAGIPVPDLYGLEREEAERRLGEAGLAAGERVELVNRDMDPGRVLAQDPVPGQQLRRGARVDYAVSSGGAQIRVPPLAGLDVIAAQELLERAGLSVELRQTRTVEVRKGAVVGTEPASGDVVRVPGTVTLLVSAGAPALDSVAPSDSVSPARTPGG
jgi:eukaryotic-like serine/threonine-protein kinase